MPRKPPKYEQVIRKVFRDGHRPDAIRVPFTRRELEDAHEGLRLRMTSNIGDIVYTYRFRRELPGEIQQTAPPNAEWIITSIGVGLYEFRLASPGKIVPSENRSMVKVADATPEIVRLYAPGRDEQALLARARYNRLVDIFSGVTCYSIQNHLRTTVPNIGQIEVDEVYVGVNKRGTHFVLPCQAKSPGDSFGIVQVMQDAALCAERYPNAICRPIALQFTDDNDVAMLELAVEEKDEVFSLRVIDEKHYMLVPGAALDARELRRLAQSEP